MKALVAAYSISEDCGCADEFYQIAKEANVNGDFSLQDVATRITSDSDIDMGSTKYN